MKKDKASSAPTSKNQKPASGKEGNSSSSAVAASKGKSASKAVKADANTDVRGSSGLANTGPLVSYNDGE